MKIWVDADACPVAVKEIVYGAAIRRGIPAIYVANKHLFMPASKLISVVKVELGLDVADRYIEEHAVPGELVITQDIPLAHLLVQKSVTVIDPRGKRFTEDNIGEKLAVRNLMHGLRETGEITGGPKQFGDKEKRAFAATFDQELTRLVNLKRRSKQADSPE